MQAHGGDDIGPHPVLGIFPALRYHALGGKIDHEVGFYLLDKAGDLLGIEIEVQLVISKISVESAFGSIGQKNRMGFGRTAYPDHVMSQPQAVGYKMRAGKGVAAKDEDEF